MTRCLLPVALASAVLASAALSQCPSQGLTLDVTSGRLGDVTTLQITGSPFAPGLLGIDSVGGPTMTSIGPVCLGLSSQLLILPFAFDANGQFGVVETLPPDPGLNGLTLFMQAAAASGAPIIPPPPLATSNGVSLTFTSPKLIIIDRGYPQYPWSPGAFCVYDALTDTPVSPVVPLDGLVRHVISIPSLGLVAFLLSNDTVRLYDSNTAAHVATIVPPTGPAGPGSPLKLASDGSKLYLLYQGYAPSFFGSGSPGCVRSYTLPAGSPILTMPLPAGNPTDLLLVPGSNVGYLSFLAGYTLGSSPPSLALPIDLTTGATLPVINLGNHGGISEWVLANGVVYCHLPGFFTAWPPTTSPTHALSAFSTTTNLPLFASPVMLASLNGPYPLFSGSGSGGSPALFMPAGTSSGAFMHEISPATLNVINSIPLAGGLIGMQISSGGTEWLLLVNTGSQMQLQTMTPPVLVPTPLATLPTTTQYFVAPLRSATVWKAYVSQNANSISPFVTDPSAAPSTSVALPFSPLLGYLVLSN